MRRRFNYTERRTIPRDRVSIRVIEEKPGQRRFDATFADLREFAPTSDARVFVMPYVGTSSMRFDCGRVGQPRAPDNRLLGDLDQGGTVLFRVLVVGDGDPDGRICAVADRISATDEDTTRDFLLPLQPAALGDVLWRVELEKDQRPVLLVNNRVAGLDARIRKDPLLAGVIFPEALRQVLLFLAAEQAWENEHAAPWAAFVRELAGDDVLSELRENSDEELEDSVRHVVEAFARRHGFAAKVAAMIGETADG
jgi:hypothetical protein